jgi:hypothetical protein
MYSLEKQIENGFQGSGITVIVLGRHDDEAIGFDDRISPIGKQIFYFLTILSPRKFEVANVERIAFRDLRAAPIF